ncbi:hypothetical protein C6P40_005426 [Pichia californica]|uniref:Alpha/beta hydrolase fold-3 domain-containing protein n=1 Tax=Pichia californica TaxID=460514 RepID=A0A9P6WL94_9ASCO|nr:hypothetical protein C6P42_000594 [[Candida] californica]KAG0689196.1 hypothetical protein C6P40_005426 [[Candida] californica]
MQSPSFSVFSNIVWKYFFTIRAFIQSYNIIELSNFKEFDDGVLIYSPCRDEKHDILIIYIPNIPLFGNSPFFYVEYLMTLQSLLLLQGFNSPGIFIMKFSEECKSSTMEYNLSKFIKNYIKLIEDNPNSKIILMGDSIGATLILNFLSIKKKIFFNEKIIYDVNSINDDIKDPFATILISPIVKFNETNFVRKSDDFLRQQNIDDISILFCSDRNAELFNPCLWKTTEIWEKIVPEGGMVITFGDQELQNYEIEEVSKIAYKTRRVKIMKSPNKCHCWQFVSFLTEETQDEKEDSCFLFAGLISRMALFQTDAYRDPSISFEPMNMLTIDDKHL